MIKKVEKTGILGIILLILIYSLISFFRNSASLPDIFKISVKGAEILSKQEFYVHLMYTIRIVFTGSAIALGIGFLIGVLCSASRICNTLIMPIINMIKNIPSVAMFPLFIVLLGIGDLPRIVVIVWNSLYAIVSSTVAGIDNIDNEIVEAAETCGADTLQMYFYIKIPLSLINILEGLKISIGSAFIAIVVAEMLGATKGIGYMILWSSNAFKYPDMYVYILIIALVGFLANVIIEIIIKFTKRRMYYG